jgi:hypothetical protein
VVLVVLLTAASLVLTMNDYFLKYARSDNTAYWFESAARNLAESLNRESGKTYLDQRYLDGWPSVRYLLSENSERTVFKPENLKPGQVAPPATVFSWPYQYQRKFVAAVAEPALVSGESGPMAKGDLDAHPYPFYNRHIVDKAADFAVLANFDNVIQLRDLQLTLKADNYLLIDLIWSSEEELDRSLTSFVHVIESDQIIGQSDTIPGQGTWPTYYWRPGLLIGDKHMIELTEEFDPSRHQITVGMYDASSGDRLTVLDAGGKPVSDYWLLEP